ncbi:MAG TPA: hypothetical protein VMU65_14705 [Candidatus Saccharimonadales bacterium]|nr:hypothetical protein [Candidatus Saccharimonadales bacterium]
MSTVPRHSEEELRQQWAFLDALVDRQAASLKSGSQDPEEVDPPAVAVEAADGVYLEELSTLTRRITTLESERATLLRRIDLAEQARMAAETGRAEAEAARMAAETGRSEAEAARVAAERALEEAQTREVPVAAPTPAVQAPPAVARTVAPVRKPPTPKRRRSWWQRFRE